MISYKWQITQMERQTTDGFVNVVHYAVIAEDEKYTSSTYGSLTYKKDNAISFAPYESLAEQTVVDWIQTSLNKNAVEASLLSAIEKQRNPDVLKGLPWKASGLPWITTQAGAGI
jgi:hypothetical protein